MKKIAESSFILLIAIFVLSCRSHSVTRISPDQQIDLSGRWNDTDSKMVSEAMIKDILGRPWLENYSKKHDGRKPVVIVGLISNKSSEHIESDLFIKDVEKAFVNTGMVRLVQNSTFREKIRQERAEQQDFASPDTQKKWGRELGADFMLFGTINSVTDSYNRKQVTLYKVNLELNDMETNEVVYIGDKEIKKYVTN